MGRERKRFYQGFYKNVQFKNVHLPKPKFGKNVHLKDVRSKNVRCKNVRKLVLEREITVFKWSINNWLHSSVFLVVCYQINFYDFSHPLDFL